MTSLSDYLRPPLPSLPDFLPASTVQYTGPTAPVFSPDYQGNLVVGTPLVASSFAAPTGADVVTFKTGVLVGGTQLFPPSSADIPLEIPLHNTLGLAQATSVLVSDLDSNPAFYTTSNPTWTGPTAQVYGTLQTANVVIGEGTGPAFGLLVAGSQGPGFYATADTAFTTRKEGGYNARVLGDFRGREHLWATGRVLATGRCWGHWGDRRHWRDW